MLCKLFSIKNLKVDSIDKTEFKVRPKLNSYTA